MMECVKVEIGEVLLLKECHAIKNEVLESKFFYYQEILHYIALFRHVAKVGKYNLSIISSE